MKVVDWVKLCALTDPFIAGLETTANRRLHCPASARRFSAERNENHIRDNPAHTSKIVGNKRLDVSRTGYYRRQQKEKQEEKTRNEGRNVRLEDVGRQCYTFGYEQRKF